MKKHIWILLSALIFLPCISLSASWNENDIIAAEFLVEKGVITDRGTNYHAYNFGYTITRREMLKVMMNISGKEVTNACEGRFSDVSEGDWGCKYAEAALREGYIAGNINFRPNDSVSKVEALKMIMQARGIERDDTEDWRQGYVSKGLSEGIINESFTDYNTASVRSWIFFSAANSYDDTPEFIENPSESQLTPEEEELLNHFLDI